MDDEELLSLWKICENSVRHPYSSVGADRILVCEALQNGYVIMTHDAEIKKYRKYGSKTEGKG